MVEAGKTVEKVTAKYVRMLVCPDHLKQSYFTVIPDVRLCISVGKSGAKNFILRSYEKDRR